MLVIQKKGIFKDRRGQALETAIEDIRQELGNTRGQLSDLADEFTGLDERLDIAGGGCTLVIAYLHHLLEELKKANEQGR